MARSIAPSSNLRADTVHQTPRLSPMGRSAHNTRRACRRHLKICPGHRSIMAAGLTPDVYLFHLAEAPPIWRVIPWRTRTHTLTIYLVHQARAVKWRVRPLASFLKAVGILMLVMRNGEEGHGILARIMFLDLPPAVCPITRLQTMPRPPCQISLPPARLPDCLVLRASTTPPNTLLVSPLQSAMSPVLCTSISTDGPLIHRHRRQGLLHTRKNVVPRHGRQGCNIILIGWRLDRVSRRHGISIQGLCRRALDRRRLRMLASFRDCSLQWK